ncbi:MAG: patatin-like protein [Erythrobacter sp.]
MRQKELRLALVCYGGVSLAVYMHGITKEIWHVARASRVFHAPGEPVPAGAAGAYHALLTEIEQSHDLRLRVLPDILTGASAGGINAVFLAQALFAGDSLEPLTDLWLSNADVSELTDPDAKPGWRHAKFWAQPIANWFLKRPGNTVSATVARETRHEVREKVSRFVRLRWFAPPFSGARFSAMLYEALTKMAEQGDSVPLLPPGHPLDLAVTVTDFRGHAELLRLHSPAIIAETEHRLPIRFRAKVADRAAPLLGDRLELVLAARATASFPGAFPPLMIEEIDQLARAEGCAWPSRGEFLRRVMPVHVRDGTVESAALIDGAVLVGRPFGAALEALHSRPSTREVDRRFVYIDPRPDRRAAPVPGEAGQVGFFGAIFGALSTIPREQPIRDDLERIEQQSRDAGRLRAIVQGMQGDIDAAVERLFGYTFFLNRPTPKRLAAWRAKAQDAAAAQSGFAFAAYTATKFSGIITRLARLTHAAAPELGLGDASLIADVLRAELAARGLEDLTQAGGAASAEAIAFFRAHDIGFRVRRLQLLTQKLSRDWQTDPAIPDDALDMAREAIYGILAIYYRADDSAMLRDHFRELARGVLERPGAVLDFLARERLLPQTDLEAEEMLVAALEDMPRELKRRMLLTYLGFPFYDVATLPLLQREGLEEFNAVKVDRISPEDARSIREGGTAACLRGIEFYNFGAFFSRAYRENDYLWGRLHGAERMVDFIASSVPAPMERAAIAAHKRRVFLAILDEEDAAGRLDGELIAGLRAEVLAQMAGD